MDGGFFEIQMACGELGNLTARQHNLTLRVPPRGVKRRRLHLPFLILPFC